MNILILFFFLLKETTYQVQVSKDKEISLSCEIKQVFKVEENIVYDLVKNKKGIYFSCGSKVYYNEKIILKEDDSGIFALTTDGENIYLGVSPESLIYLIKDSQIIKRYKIPASNILRMLYIRENLIVGTAYPALIYQLGEKNEKLFEINDENVSALTYEKETLFIGTSPKGYLLKANLIKKDLKLLYDCEEEEIKDIIKKGNFLYFITNSDKKLPSLYSFDLIKNECKEVFTFPCSTLFSLAIKEDTLLVCGSDNLLYKILLDGNYFTLYGFGCQILTKIFIYQKEIYLGTGYPAKIYQLKNELANEGTYFSEIIDLKFISNFGRMDIESYLPLFTSYQVYTRSGQNNIIDETWSDFLPLKDDKIKSPSGRYFQYLIRLKREKGKESPIIKKIHYFYKNVNQSPKIKELKILPDTINPRIKIINWEISDPNNDLLINSLYYQIKGDKNWYLLAKNIKENEYKLNGEILPDGYYQIKLLTSDELSQGKEEALKDSLIFKELLIDNTPPKLISFKKDKIKEGYLIKIKVLDSLSIIKGFFYSFDNNEEEKISPIDKIFDFNEEEFIFKVNKEKFLLNIRFYDEYLNEKRLNWLIK